MMKMYILKNKHYQIPFHNTHHTKNNLNLIEVYDNSHIQGTNSVGAMVTFGEEGFVKKRYRKIKRQTTRVC